MAESEAETPSTPGEFESKYFEYNGVRLPPFCRGKMEEIANFPVRDSDVWIVTYPKSGRRAPSPFFPPSPRPSLPRRGWGWRWGVGGGGLSSPPSSLTGQLAPGEARGTPSVPAPRPPSPPGGRCAPAEGRGEACTLPSAERGCPSGRWLLEALRAEGTCSARVGRAAPWPCGYPLSLDTSQRQALLLVAAGASQLNCSGVKMLLQAREISLSVRVEKRERM